jgi:hypothetical protein
MSGDESGSAPVETPVVADLALTVYLVIGPDDAWDRGEIARELPAAAGEGTLGGGVDLESESSRLSKEAHRVEVGSAVA